MSPNNAEDFAASLNIFFDSVIHNLLHKDEWRMLMGKIALNLTDSSQSCILEMSEFIKIHMERTNGKKD